MLPRTLLLALLLSLVWSAPAHAYLDPGTGSMILTTLLGGLTGLLVAGKLIWRWFKGRLGIGARGEKGR